MVQAQDLRIGNWLFNSDIGINFQINAYYLLRLYNNNSDNFKPKLLTSMILEKVGAKFDGQNYILNIGALKMKFRYNIEWYSEIDVIYLGSRIQYVHQLQNFKHALTGSELMIKI